MPKTGDALVVFRKTLLLLLATSRPRSLYVRSFGPLAQGYFLQNWCGSERRQRQLEAAPVCSALCLSAKTPSKHALARSPGEYTLSQATLAATWLVIERCRYFFHGVRAVLVVRTRPLPVLAAGATTQTHNGMPFAGASARASRCFGPPSAQGFCSKNY